MDHTSVLKFERPCSRNIRRLSEERKRALAPSLRVRDCDHCGIAIAVPWRRVLAVEVIGGTRHTRSRCERFAARLAQAVAA